MKNSEVTRVKKKKKKRTEADTYYTHSRSCAREGGKKTHTHTDAMTLTFRLFYEVPASASAVHRP